MKIPDNIKNEILTYCKAVEPQEACGFVIFAYQTHQPLFLPCENRADNPEQYFEISPEDFIRAEKQGEIIAVVHSHPEGEMRLSIADRQMQDNAQLDFWLVCEDKIHIFPTLRPLVGREFQYGVEDCFTIVRDFYFLAGIDFPDVVRVEGWWQQDPTYYLSTLIQLGFEQVSDIQVGDVVLMCFNAESPNHGAIYLGEQQILHHLNEKRLSRRELYNAYWQQQTHSIWRLPRWRLSPLNFMVPLNHLARHSSLR